MTPKLPASPPAPDSSESVPASSAGVPFCATNLRVDEWYIKVGPSLFPFSHFTLNDLPAEAEQIRVLSKQMGCVVVEQDLSYVLKFGSAVRPCEEQAMRLVSQHTSIPIPRVVNSKMESNFGQIVMTIIPGAPLDRSWMSLDEKTRLRLCRETWTLLTQLRDIPRPPACEGLFQCMADGSTSDDALLQDLDQPPHKHIYTDDGLRARLYERYLHFNGRRYKDSLPDMLPRSSESVFTHADIAPRNIMVNEKHEITGILDWELSGWYPDYWEYSQIMRHANKVTTDWAKWMDLTAPQRWDVSGINASRRVLF
ncbi:hypothetical protein FQN49_001349 [Arthroderma sp. PD_2]|nr:hypothetical protein FQN49_001349 [Arthroderma sp. PD_2]